MEWFRKKINEASLSVSPPLSPLSPLLLFPSLSFSFSFSEDEKAAILKPQPKAAKQEKGNTKKENIIKI